MFRIILSTLIVASFGAQAFAAGPAEKPSDSKPGETKRVDEPGRVENKKPTEVKSTLDLTKLGQKNGEEQAKKDAEAVREIRSKSIGRAGDVNEGNKAYQKYYGSDAVSADVKAREAKLTIMASEKGLLNPKNNLGDQGLISQLAKADAKVAEGFALVLQKMNSKVTPKNAEKMANFIRGVANTTIAEANRGITTHIFREATIERFWDAYSSSNAIDALTGITAEITTVIRTEGLSDVAAKRKGILNYILSVRGLKGLENSKDPVVQKKIAEARDLTEKLLMENCV